MKALPWLLLIALSGFGIWATLSHRRDLDAAEAYTAVLRAEKDSASSVAAELADQAERWRLQADSLASVATRLRAVARAREEALSARADSLSEEIAALVPEGAVREEVALAVARLRGTYEERLAGLQEIIGTQDAEIAALRETVALSERSRESLRRALASAEAEIEVWRDAANPGIFERITGNLPLVGGSLGIGLLLGFFAG